MNLLTALRELVDGGMTQREIARELGCSQSNVSQMFHGKIGATRPSAKVVTGIERLLNAQRLNRQIKIPAPEIPADLQNAAVMLKGLSGKFADEDAIAWFLQLKPKSREEIFELHDCITSAMCIDEINRNQQSNGGQR